MSADDEQDMPFRWSLFLPAAGDSPSMRGMKYAVIGMGIILVLGLATIIARIVYLTTRVEASLPAGSELSLEVPAGADIKTMSLNGNRLALYYTGPGSTDRYVAILDLSTGRTLSRVRLAPGDVPPNPEAGKRVPAR